MPPIPYMNQTAPFWDFVADLEEQQGSPHPWFAGANGPSGGENEHPNPWTQGWMGYPFGPLPHRGWHGGPHARGARPTPAAPTAEENVPAYAGEKDMDAEAGPSDARGIVQTDSEGEKKVGKGLGGRRGGRFAGRGRGAGFGRGRGGAGPGAAFAAAHSDSENEKAGKGSEERRAGRCGGRGRGAGMGGKGRGFGGPGAARGNVQSDSENEQSAGHAGRRGPHGRGPGFGGRGRGPHGGFPFGGFGPLAGMLQNQLYGANKESSDDFTPEADVFDTPDAFVVHVSLPGAKKEDVGVNWDSDKSQLSIAGVVYRPGDEEFLKTLAMDERKVGAFERKVRLGSRANPAQVDVDAISARMEDGVLRIDVPKLDSEYVEIKKVDIE